MRCARAVVLPGVDQRGQQEIESNPEISAGEHQRAEGEPDACQLDDYPQQEPRQGNQTPPIPIPPGLVPEHDDEGDGCQRDIVDSSAPVGRGLKAMDETGVIHGLEWSSSPREGAHPGGDPTCPRLSAASDAAEVMTRRT